MQTICCSCLKKIEQLKYIGKMDVIFITDTWQRKRVQRLNVREVLILEMSPNP